MISPLAVGWAVGASVVASLRVAHHEKRLGLPELVECLRGGRRWPGWLAEPESCARVVGRLAPFLPPHGMGPCLKRSLLLVDLWSRCGLQPRLHLGLQRSPEGGHAGHAWLTVDPPGQEWSAGQARAVEIATF